MRLTLKQMNAAAQPFGWEVVKAARIYQGASGYHIRTGWNSYVGQF